MSSDSTTASNFTNLSSEASSSSTGDISSIDNYFSIEKVTSVDHSTFTAQQISSISDDDDAETAFEPTNEHLILLARQQHDPPSYYSEPSLNKGPIDKVPRLSSVSSQYAYDDLHNYAAMDNPEAAYKLKSAETHYSNTMSPPVSTASGIDHSKIHYHGEFLCFGNQNDY